MKVIGRRVGDLGVEGSLIGSSDGQDSQLLRRPGYDGDIIEHSFLGQSETIRSQHHVLLPTVSGLN